MDTTKVSLSSFLRKLHISKGGSFSIKSFWRLIMISYFIIAVSIVVFGWLIYAWSITTTSTMVRQIRQKPSITLGEIKKASEILASKKYKLESVINNKVEVMGLR